MIILISQTNIETGVAYAQKSEISNFRLSGYGTLAYTVDDRSDMAPMRDFTQRPDDGFRTGSTWKLDSRLGLQAHYRFSPEIDFVLQGVLRDQIDITVRNSLESAYLEIKPSPRIDVRAGRLGYDAFLMSDTRNIGYAYPWVRPPTEFYGWIPIFSVDGVDASYLFDIGEFQYRIKAQIGKSFANLPIASSEVYDAATRDLYSLTVSGQSGPFRIKAGYSQFTLKNEVQAFIPLQEGLEAVQSATSDALPRIASEANYLHGNISFKNTDITYLTFGAAYDDGTWLAQAEVSHSTSTANVVPHGNMAYLGVGRRLGDWTPYLLFSLIHPTYDTYDSNTDWAPIGQETFQGQTLSVLNGTRTEQETFSLGVRWDFHNQAALKLQCDNSHVKPYHGLWWRDHPTSQQASHINLWTFSLEFVF